MILHHLLLSLLLLQIVAKKDKDFLKRMTRQSLKEATCIKAKVTANRRTGTSNVVFRMTASLFDGTGGELCTPAVHCGLLFFPKQSEPVLHAVMRSKHLQHSIQGERQLQFAFGSRGRIAQAFIKGAQAASRKRSTHEPLAYLIRRIDRVHPSSGVDRKALRKEQMLSDFGITIGTITIFDTQEEFDNIVIPLDLSEFLLDLQ